MWLVQNDKEIRVIEIFYTKDLWYLILNTNINKNKFPTLLLLSLLKLISLFLLDKNFTTRYYWNYYYDYTLAKLINQRKRLSVYVQLDITSNSKCSKNNSKSIRKISWLYFFGLTGGQTFICSPAKRVRVCKQKF